MIGDYFSYVLRTFRTRKVRSWLTMLGIFIGIAAVVALVSLGQGLETAINDQFEALGKDKIIIQPRSAFTGSLSSVANPLTKEDVEVVKDVRGVAEVSGGIYTTGKVEMNDIVRYFFIMGMPTDENRKLIEQISSFNILKGRELRRGDDHKIVLGYDYLHKDFFGQTIRLRDRLTINDVEFSVIGFMERIGNPTDDSSILVTEESLRLMIGEPEEVGYIFARSAEGVDPLKVAENIKKDLRQARDVEEGEEDFDVQTPEQLLATFSVVLGIVQAVLVGIAAISLFVGGVGIMNTMYTSVLERTQEIGIMKAIGARNRQILLIFLIESGSYGLVGGIIGVLIGLGLASFAGYIADAYLGTNLLQAYISTPLVAGALIFSFVVGVISGVAPAYQASKLKPVEALRYE
jgi:putative ABC transport system permease protein